MTTAFYTHEDCLGHVTPQGHPERVARLEAILKAMDAPDFADLDRREAPLGARDEILRVHPESHVRAIEDAIPEQGIRSLDADTHVMAGSLKAALRGVGGVISAVDAVMAGDVANAFVATRPPGHHAEKTTPMGFCLFGNVAIAAKRALDHHGLSRVAIVDFDVHHGNGTQDLMWDEPRCLFISTHQSPLYPGTGAAHETGAHANVMNIPLEAHTNGAAYCKIFEREVLVALKQFEPQLVIISAGFDAHMADPLANIDLSADDFAWATQKLCDVANAHAAGRVVSVLEGGYDLDGLATSTAAHVKVLMERGA